MTQRTAGGGEAVLKTKYLFLNLIKALRPDAVLDVGSMDGSDSLRFRRMCPAARIVAYEANPHNFDRMAADPRLRDARVELSSSLVSSSDRARLYVSRASVENTGNKGTSSSLRPIDDSQVVEEVDVPATTLRAEVGRLGLGGRSLALWIDVEGAAWDVLAGAKDLGARILVAHVEAETLANWSGQKLKDDVVRMAGSLGLELLARSRNDAQQDLVFVDRGLLAERGALVRNLVRLTRAHGPASSRILETFWP